MSINEPDWRDLRSPHERMRWARMYRGKFEQAKDAAESIGIKEGTYRSYERRAENAGRVPPMVEMQRIATKFKVSWIWLASGQGDPDKGLPADDERLQLIARRAEQVPADKREDALNAAISVLESFIRRAG